MNSTLPPDPYKLLGVEKDAKLPEIRSAHRKLVLKCHPDKVQDAELKAIKVDEFQKVQQAYELLSDETRRVQYDEQVKLFELRKEMGRGIPTPRSNPFEYEVKTAEPRPDSFTRSQTSPKVYSYSSADRRSREQVYDEPRHMHKKSSSFEERHRTSAREEDSRREARTRKQHEEEERARLREKEAKRNQHSEKKKSRDKERKKGSEEKISKNRGGYFEDDSSDELGRTPPRASEKKSSRHKASSDRIEEEIRSREDTARAEEAARKARAQPPIKEAPLDPKWSDHMEFAGAYMQAARRKGTAEEVPHPPAPQVPHPQMRRAETFAAPPSAPYDVRYAAPSTRYEEDDSPRRSSARKDTRRTSDTPATRRRSRDRGERRSSPSHPRDPHIVEPPPPQATGSRKPSLQTFSSAPPVFAREMPSRSKTEYPANRSPEMPSFGRAQTFSDNRSRERGSKLRQEVSSDSESEGPIYHDRLSHSPPPSRRAPEPTRYTVVDGRANPVTSNTTRHRSELRDLNEAYPRDRSESPRGTTARYVSERPPVSRNPGSVERLRSNSRPYPVAATYYSPVGETPEPIVLQARPKMSREQGSVRSAKYAAPNGAPFEKVIYTKSYGPEHVTYAAHPAANMYGGSRREHDDYYAPHPRGGHADSHPVYAQ